MKKKFIAVALVLAMSVTAMAGCGKKSDKKSSDSDTTDYTSMTAEELQDTVLKDVEDYVTIGDYSNIEVEVSPVAVVTDGAVETELQSWLDFYPLQFEGACVSGDSVNIDYVGKIDGNEFDGGTYEGYDLELGSGSFITGFEEQVEGMSVGDTKDINVTFPEDYHSEDLKGKEAVFKCTVHAIRAKELPEVDDEFASDVSEKAETLDAYRAEVKAQIKERKENEGKAKKEDQAVEQAVANAEIDLPEPMVDLQAKQMADDFARRIMQQGLSVEQYFQFTGLSEEKMMEELKPQAEKRIRTRLVLEAIVAAENIEVSDERLDEELAKMAESYKMEVEKLKEFMGENEKKQMKEDIAVQDAVTLIVDASVEG